MGCVVLAGDGLFQSTPLTEVRGDCRPAKASFVAILVGSFREPHETPAC